MSKAQGAQARTDTLDTRPLRIGKPRAAMVVYQFIKGEPHVLLVPTAKRKHRLTLPGGKIDRNETSEQAAMRETAEEAGVLTDRPQPLGAYLHRKRKRRYHHTDTFLARCVGTLHEYEGRARVWVHLDQIEALKPSVRKLIRKQLKHAFTTLHRRHRAA